MKSIFVEIQMVFQPRSQRDFGLYQQASKIDQPIRHYTLLLAQKKVPIILKFQSSLEEWKSAMVWGIEERHCLK